MTHMTLHQFAEIVIKVVGGALLIVLLSYPICNFANYVTGNMPAKAPAVTAQDDVRKPSTWLPGPIAKMFGSQKPANGLVPPPPPIAY